MTTGAVELRHDDLDEKIVGPSGNLGLNQRPSRRNVSVKELCSAQERQRKRCGDDEWLDAEGQEENESKFAGESQREVETRLE